MAKKAEIVPAAVHGGSYLAEIADAKSIATIIKDNCGHITANDLDRVKVPAGGGLAWEVPSLEGIEQEKELVGVVVLQREVRAYWAEEYKGGNTPPDCSSPDAEQGYGQPGGVCATCPLSQWDSDPKGSGQACKAMNLLFLLREGSILPSVIVVPPSSLANIRRFMIRLASKAISYSSVVLAFTLEKAKNDTGITYSKITVTMKRPLLPAEAEKIQQYREALMPVFKQVRINEAAE